MVKRAILRIGDELEEKQVSVNKAYKFREGSMGVIKNSNIIQKQGKGNILFYAEHIEERKTHRPYYAIWVDHYTEQDIGASVGYNMIYPMEYDNKPAVIFMRKESVLNPPIEEGDVFTIGLGIINDRPSFVVKVFKKHGTFVPHIQKEIKVYK